MANSINVWQALADSAQATPTSKTSLKSAKTSSSQDIKKIPLLNKPGEYYEKKTRKAVKIDWADYETIVSWQTLTSQPTGIYTTVDHNF